VPGRVDQLQDVARVVDPHVLGLDGDAALALDVHRVEVLCAHETRVDGAGQLQDPVRERGLAVVDVRNDGKVPDFAGIDGRLLSGHGVERLPGMVGEASKWSD